MFFFKPKRKNFLAAKRYKLERTVRYRNPHRPKASFLNLKFSTIFNFFLLLAICGGVYFFLFSSFYNITNVEVVGNNIISTDDILDITYDCVSSHRFLVFKNHNIFIFSRNLLKDKINEKVITNDLKVEKILPNTLRITIKEKLAVLKWVTNEEQYLLDGNGIIIKRFYKKIMPKLFQLADNTNATPEPASSDLDQADGFLKITNATSQTVSLGDKVINPEDIEFITKVSESLKDYDYLKVEGLIVPNNFPSYLEVALANNTKIYFNLFDSLDKQLARLNLLIEKDIKKENLHLIDYIDLRLGQNTYILRK